MKPSLNLATRTYLNRSLLYAGYTVAVVLLLGGLVGFGNYFWQYRQAEKVVAASLEQMQQQAMGARGANEVPFSSAAYQQVLQRISFYNEVLAKDSFRWTHLLSRMEELVPDGVGLRSIQPDFHNRSLKIGGLARNLDKLQRFLDNLLAAKDFSAVYLLNQARVQGTPQHPGLQDELQFSIVLEGAF